MEAPVVGGDGGGDAHGGVYVLGVNLSGGQFLRGVDLLDFDFLVPAKSFQHGGCFVFVGLFGFGGLCFTICANRFLLLLGNQKTVNIGTNAAADQCTAQS